MAASPPPQWQKRWPRTPRQWSQAWRRRRCRSMRSRRGAAAQAPLQPAAALLTWLSSCCASMLWGQTQRRLAALPRCSRCWRACSGAAAVLRVDIRSCVVLLENKMWQSCQVAFPALLTPGCPALVAPSHRPSGLTPDPLDYAFPWHLLSVLGAVGALPPAVVELPQGGGHRHCCCCVAYWPRCLVATGCEVTPVAVHARKHSPHTPCACLCSRRRAHELHCPAGGSGWAGALGGVRSAAHPGCRGACPGERGMLVTGVQAGCCALHCLTTHCTCQIEVRWQDPHATRWPGIIYALMPRPSLPCPHCAGGA